MLEGMRESSDEMPFTFVNYDGPRLSYDPNVRRLIRKRAMKDIAAARKQRGDYGKHNLAQYPMFLNENGLQEDWLIDKTVQSDSSFRHHRQDGAPSEGEIAAKLKRRSRDSADSCRYLGIHHIPCSDL